MTMPARAMPETRGRAKSQSAQPTPAACRPSSPGEHSCALGTVQWSGDRFNNGPQSAAPPTFSWEPG
jgi:hypothetical protein